jgi:ComF family protein
MNTQTRIKALDGRLLSTIRWSLSHCASFVLDLLYPLACAGCGKVGEGVWCAACDARIPRLMPPEQQKFLPLDPPWQDRQLLVASGARYGSPLREAIHAFKYDGTPGLAATLAPLLLDAWRHAALNADVIVPVPLHARRRRERGYNQSELLAREVGAACGVPVDTQLLARVRYTDQQALLKGAARKQNVQDAFAAGAGANGKLIVLVDDVLTSGATLTACASVLLNAGAASVCALTLARAE